MKNKFLLKLLSIISAAVIISTPVYADNNTYSYDENESNSVYSYDDSSGDSLSSSSGDTSYDTTDDSYNTTDTTNSDSDDNSDDNSSSTATIYLGEVEVSERDSNSIPSKAEAYDYFVSSHSGLGAYTNDDDSITYNGDTYKYNSTYGIYTKNGAKPTDEDDDYTSYIEAYRSNSEERWIVYTLQNLYNEKQIEEGRAKNQSIAQLQKQLSETTVSLNVAKQNASSASVNTVSSADIQVVTGQLYVEAKVFDDFTGDGYITVMCTDTDENTTDESDLETYNIYLYQLNDYKQQYELPVGHYMIIDGGSATDLTAYKTTTKYDPESIEFEITPNDVTNLSIQLGDVDGTRNTPEIQISGNEPVKIETAKKNKLPVGFIIRLILAIICFIGLVFFGIRVFNKLRDSDD